MREWFEDEDFWEKLFPFLFTERKFDVAEQEVVSVLNLAGLESGEALDLACGPGRHSTALSMKGFRVTGVDLSPFLLSEAQNLARLENVDIEWVREDMRNFVRPDSFDLVINLFTSFGYFDDRRDDARVLRNIHQSLRDEAVLVMEMAGKECLAKDFEPTHSKKLADGRLLIERREVVDNWTRIRNEWIVVEDGTATTFQFETAIYSAQELKDQLFEAGFSEVEVFGDLEGGEYGVRAQRLVAVARK